MSLRKCLLAVPSLLLLSLADAAPAPASHGADSKMLNNEGLVVLARAGYNERFLVELIHSQPGRFDTSVEGLVYLAQQGISEKIVRLVIAEQRADERRQAERAAAPDTDDPFSQPAEPAKTPVRMKVVKQKVLAPASPMAQPLGANPVIMVEKRMFGDRYYAIPGTQAPAMMTPAGSPNTQQSRPLAATTRVAAFR